MLPIDLTLSSTPAEMVIDRMMLRCSCIRIENDIGKQVHTDWLIDSLHDRKGERI